TVAAGFQVSGLLSCSWLQLSQPMSSGVSGEEGSACLWKALTYFMVLPRVGVSMLDVFLKLHHREKRPEFIPFPWGDGNHILFHNTCVNPVPTGYGFE
ncbi:hypothetical protein K5549_020755, partial [Capra hircus]|uniref:Cytochrome c oxidase polypeptide VIa n=1 Tax=Capra hircus TaxID=9925 RepID=A0A452ECQ5_CAPHI